MRNLAFILFSSYLSAQTAFFNSGNVQLHDGAKIGFHTDVVNNGVLNNYIGFAGFYANTETRIISGSNRVAFFDVEIDASNNLELQNSLGVRNQLDFINGTVVTPRNNPNISLDFINYDSYAGEDDVRHVDGYSSIRGGDPSFTFPIGDGTLLRPMRIPNKNQYDLFKGAYFYEDPNSPITFSTNFLTDQKQVMLENISNLEFWDLDGSKETRITLTWDARSDISAISDQVSLLTVVGWSIAENRWENLNVLNVTGDLTSGEITSAVFVPDNYEVITIGSIVKDVIETDSNNILISPNGDNLNDFLVFDEVAQYSNNNLVIFNRWGNIVYQTDEYKNNWNGISSGRATFKKTDKLPDGTYFYVLKLGDTPASLITEKKGWVYIHR
ncbi:T9SS C-terminal target domain-containing protein [Tenacibaculum ovolyticum]|uniref:gliding motility-associated C-terminal domain-containing protein n=1 Tax=Tenacibaculum ovolyticum TaxID=104270 RepID=UPI000400F4DB|nr:T9SS C-terminal target domain-containing protein [Tenacibaculum ovolyticum]WBX75234.1 T9SS C-terminal target domain-containing protein [Tenacibaculum ovolyticum]